MSLLAYFRLRRALRRFGDPADTEIICDVGFHQLSGGPPTVKQVELADFASMTTIRKRLGRLCRDGILMRLPSPQDGRASQVVLAPAALAILHEAVS